MKKIILLLFITTGGFTQGIFLPDSAEVILFKDYQTKLEQALAADSDFIAELTDKHGQFYDNAFQYERFHNITIDELEMELFDQILAQESLIKSGAKDEFLKEYLLNELKAQYWHLIFAYPVIRGNADQKSKRLTSVPDVVTAGFNKEMLTTKDALKSKALRNLILNWVTYENSRNNNFEKYTNLLLGVNDKVEFALEHLDGLVADYALDQILKSHQGYLSNSLAQNIISQINSEEIRDAFTGEFLDEVFAMNEKKDAEQKAKDTAKPSLYDHEFVDLKGKKFTLEQYKGKIIYLDFWASWCGPCRAQFPYSKKLHEQLPNKLKKKIVFLYISIDDTQEKWKNGIESLGLEKYENGYTEGAWGSPILQQLGVRSIPRYLILDKEGKVIDGNAARPSSPEILPTLIQLAE